MKTIKMSVLNKIKICSLRIFEAEDDDYPDRRIVARNQRTIDNLLKNYTEEERIELVNNIRWEVSNCSLKLEQLGWEITKGK